MVAAATTLAALWCAVGVLPIWLHQERFHEIVETVLDQYSPLNEEVRQALRRGLYVGVVISCMVRGPTVFLHQWR